MCERPKRGLFSGLFEGWQVAALGVFLPLATALVVVPRSVEPFELPDVTVDAQALARSTFADNELARRSVASLLDTDIRALGTAVRAFGAAEASGDEAMVGAARRAIPQVLGLALERGAAEILELRAVQLQAFLEAFRAYQLTSEQSVALKELGGVFVDNAVNNGLLNPLTRDFSAGEDALRILFKKRWNAVIDAQAPWLALSPDEERAYYRFMLRDSRPTPTKGALSEQRAQAVRDKYRLKKLDELAAVDPSYPRDLARGILYYRLGSYGQAVESFRRHLSRFPDGRFSLRAQNYLRASLGRVAEAPP